MHQHVRADVVSSYPFAAAMVRPPVVSAPSPGQAPASRWRHAFRRALRRIVRGLRICVTSAGASTTSSLRRAADTPQIDAKPKPQPSGAFLRRMD